MNSKPSSRRPVNLFEKTSCFVKGFSAVMCNLAGYTVVNGLIYFFVASAHCKYPSFDKVIFQGMAFFIALLFVIFLLDVFINYLPAKDANDKNKSACKRIAIYLGCFIGGGFLSWFYIAGVYAPLFSLPSHLLTCGS
ncbi:hypothetical protein ACR71G_22375 [Xenorhabdus bovienii]|uniref:hypothetical protein n=1 Tax=Xenorhabdus bovienii TaxID=40576 RepID=UPI003DA690A2